VQRLIELSGERRNYVLKERIEKNIFKPKTKFKNDKDKNFETNYVNIPIKAKENSVYKVDYDDDVYSNNNSSSSFFKKETKFKFDYQLLQQNILFLFQGSLVEMSMRKYSNNIVEKCLEFFLGEEKIKLLEELVKGINYSKF
jgi:hypothetical protein